MDEVWVELQAHLQGRQKEEQREWLHYSSGRVSKTLMQASDDVMSTAAFYSNVTIHVYTK